MDSSPPSKPAINPPNISATNSTNNSTTASNISSNDNNNASNSNNNCAEKTAGSDLKSSIIDFMRERPFLWNSKHPNYKDHKRREQEFQQFSNQIGFSVQEIKRVWHVLRTNFFRAHKLLLDRPQSTNGENGEKLWKYYLAMEYILDSSPNSKDASTRQTRSSKASKEVQRNSIGSSTNTSTNNNTNIRLTTQQQRELNNNSSSSNTRSCSGNRNSSGNNNHQYHNMSNSSLNSSSLNKSAFSDLTIFDEADHSYARSLTSTLKRFDPTTKEIIKLKFQEIIVNYMQQQQQQQQQHQQQQLQQPQQLEAIMQQSEPLPTLKIDNK